MGIFSKKPKANPLREFEAAITKAIGIAKLAGVSHPEMASAMSSFIVSFERQALTAQDQINYGSGLPKYNPNLPQRYSHHFLLASSSAPLS